ncbi:MAG: hypothetical protein B7Y25_06605 [Alphaproteobacteria bacterium 16-39-46]|nr:MAG: hypothetical protein B7Y25_06605 [Alphaproteobacteria bacterium 16-39-46]OZA42255.1 MAG: hypothetical protein B7X84_06680 [Alphaproteobacteria bacterium 17-39-52]HQS84554.1 O-antigen ligase family protein [Alphaproteobacteria bacterium]HQS94307.1 O-antigen ligase family protein [Alphaproteobacteria bacterium]
MKNFFSHFKNPLLWPFYLFGPIAYGGGNGILILLGFLCICLFFKDPSIKRKSFQQVWHHFWAPFRSLSLPLFILFCLWVYMTFTAFWSLQPLYALGTALRLLFLFALTGTLISQIRNLPLPLIKKCLLGFVASWSVLILLLILTLILDILGHELSWINNVNFLKKPSQITRPALFASLFFWPSCAFFIFQTKHSFFQRQSPFFQEILFFTLGISVVFITYFLNMSAASLGLFLGLSVYLFLKKFPSFFSILLNAAVGLGFVFPFCTKYILNSLLFISSHKPSWAHRLVIWDFVSDAIKQCPYLGWGLEASRFLPSSTIELFLTEETSPLFLNTLPLHPHNAFLQVWLEGGVIGASLLSCFLFFLISFLKKTYFVPKERALIGGTFITFLTPFYVSFGVWQTWWLSTLCFITILWILLKKSNKIK